jgi:hypothetical protein
VFGIGAHDREAVAQGHGSDDDILNTDRLSNRIEVGKNLGSFQGLLISEVHNGQFGQNAFLDFGPESFTVLNPQCSISQFHDAHACGTERCGRDGS